MLKSSNFESILNEIGGDSRANYVCGSTDVSTATNTTIITTDDKTTGTSVHDVEGIQKAMALAEIATQKSIESTPSNVMSQATARSNEENKDSALLSPAVNKLSTGFVQIYEPSLVKVRSQLKELICKQNKIYIDLSAEKYKFDNSEMVRLNEMMINVKLYREKLLKIKKRMQSIYQRTKVLKKRAVNIEAYKHKELQRKIQKQQQEEALIAKQH